MGIFFHNLSWNTSQLLSCCSGMYVLYIPGTRHSKLLIILQAAKYKLWSQLTNTFIYRISATAWLCSYAHSIELPVQESNSTYTHECKWHFSTGLHAVPQHWGQVILLTRAWTNGPGDQLLVVLQICSVILAKLLSLCFKFKWEWCVFFSLLYIFRWQIV